MFIVWLLICYDVELLLWLIVMLMWLELLVIFVVVVYDVL